MTAIKVLKISGGIILIICAVLLFYFYHNYYEKDKYDVSLIINAYVLGFVLLFFAMLLLASAFNWM